MMQRCERDSSGRPWGFVAGVLCVALSGGCFLEQGPRASPVVVALDESQQGQVHGVLEGAFGEVSTPSEPLRLTASGLMRWSDLRRGVGLACHQPEVQMAVVQARVQDDTAVFHLMTAQGWPGIVRAWREGDEIRLEAVVGPYPRSADAARRSAALETAVVQAMRTCAELPRLPEIDGISRR